MDFSLTDDQRLIRDTIRQFMEAEVRPSIRARDREEKFAGDELRKLGELGCCCMLIPESWGGLGADTISYVLMLEEVARVDAAMAVALSVTNSLAVLPVFKYGSESQKQKYLSSLAHGEILGAFCLTEPQAGSDAAAIATSAERHGGMYRLNGTKSWVTNGGEAGLYVVFAKTDPSAGAKGVTAFLVEPSFPGFRVARYEDKMGLRTSRSAEITFTDCEVPEGNRLGEEGQGLKIALELLDGGRVGIAAQAVGIAQGALEASVAYAKERRAFGKTIGDFQADTMDARRHADGNRSRASPGAPCRVDARHGRAAPRPVRLARKIVCGRNGESRRLQSRANPRQPGLFARVGRRANVSRRPRDHDLRRHQRNPAHDHRARFAVIRAQHFASAPRCSRSGL